MKIHRQVIALACALACAPSVAHADVVWREPQTLASGLGGISATGLAMADDGTAIAVWTQSPGIGWAHWDGRLWSAPEVISAPGAVNPSIAISDDATDALLCFEVSKQVWASTWDGSVWSAPTPASSVSEYFAAPTSLINDDGSDKMVVWQHRAGGNYTVQASRRAGGVWSAPVEVADTGTTMPSPAAAMADSGNAVVAFAVPGWGTQIATARWESGSWTAPEQLTAEPVVALLPSPAVAVADDGTEIAAIWSSTIPGGSLVRAAVRTPLGWGAPSDLTPLTAGAFSWPRVALDQDGDVGVGVWGPGFSPLTPSDIQAVVRTEDTWQSTATLDTAGSVFPQAAVAADGSSVWALWNRTDGSIGAAQWTAGQWQPVITLSAGGVTASLVRVAMATPSDVLAVWRTSAGSVQATAPATVPDAPVAVTGSAGDSSIRAMWTAPAYTGGVPVTSYVASASPGGASCTTTDGSCVIDGLTNGVGYTVTVVARNAVGVSAPSEPSEVIVPQPAPTVSPSTTPAPTVSPSTTPAPTATQAPVKRKTIVTGWPRRVSAAKRVVVLRPTVVPGESRLVRLQRRTAKPGWRTVRRLTTADTTTARLRLRLRLGTYRLVIPATQDATDLVTTRLRVIRAK